MKPSTLIRRLSVAIVASCLCGSLFADEADFPLSPNRTQQASTLMESALNVGPTSAPSGPPKHPLKTVASSLAIVLGGFLLLAALLRKKSPNKANASELMETLGTFHVTPKVKLHLVRIGSRLLVLHVGASSVECVAEITQPAEVQQLLSGEFQSQDAPLNTKLESIDTHPQVHELLRSITAGDGVAV